MTGLPTTVSTPGSSDASVLSRGPELLRYWTEKFPSIRDEAEHLIQRASRRDGDAREKVNLLLALYRDLEELDRAVSQALENGRVPSEFDRIDAATSLHLFEFEMLKTRSVLRRTAETYQLPSIG